MDMDSSAHITDPRKEVRKSWPRALEPTSIQAADLPSSSDYSLRRDWMREWALDLDQLAVLRDQLTTTQAELECTRCENTALNSAVDIMRADAEVYKETIVTQRLAVKTLQNRVQVDRETHQQLLQSYSNVLTELDQVKAELARQASAFVELQRQKDEEQIAHTNRLKAEILSVFTQAQENTRQSLSVGPGPGPAATGGMSASSSARSGNAVPETIDSTSRPPTIPLRASSASISAPNGNMVQPRLETLPSTSRLPATTLHVSGSQCSAPSGNVTRPQAKSAGIVKPETIKDEDEDDIIIVTSSGLKSPNYLTPVPEGRRKELEAFPEFVPNVGESAVFSRGFLSATLGGNTQSLIVQIALQKSLAKSCNVKKFLCPNQSQNPWCPRAPGEHGYMFVGLGNERDTFREPEQLHLFLSVPPSKSKALDVTYLGFYEVSRVAELTVDEWGTLSPTVQGNYASTTANRQSSKNQAKPPVAPIRAEYDSGARQVPCVRLRCIGFDEALYAGLVAANSPGLSNNKRRSDADSPYPKRPRREEDVA